MTSNGRFSCSVECIRFASFAPQVAWPPTSFPPLPPPSSGAISVPSAFMSPSGAAPSASSAFLPFRPASASAVPLGPQSQTLGGSHHPSAFSRPGQGSTGGGSSTGGNSSSSSTPQPGQHLLDIPPESLNMSPIVEQPWNEPDGSEGKSFLSLSPLRSCISPLSLRSQNTQRRDFPISSLRRRRAFMTRCQSTR